MKSILLGLLLLCSQNICSQVEYEDLFGDSIKTFQWSLGIAYLPSPNSHAISLEANSKRVKAQYVEYKYSRFGKRHKKRNVRITKKEFVNMQLRFVELTQNNYKIALSNALKDSLRQHVNDTNYRGERYYKITPNLLENYLQKDSLEIDHQVFQKDQVDFLSSMMSVIDGAPFSFQMRTISNENDTLQFTYEGNLAGNDDFVDYGKHLAIRILNAETSFYKKFPMNYYFNDTRYYAILLKYLAAKEGLLESIPSQLYIESIEVEDD